MTYSNLSQCIQVTLIYIKLIKYLTGTVRQRAAHILHTTLVSCGQWGHLFCQKRSTDIVLVLKGLMNEFTSVLSNIFNTISVSCNIAHIMIIFQQHAGGSLLAVGGNWPGISNFPQAPTSAEGLNIWKHLVSHV